MTCAQLKAKEGIERMQDEARCLRRRQRQRARRAQASSTEDGTVNSTPVKECSRQEMK